MPCVTVLTDFATADGYVGAMKGVLLARCPGLSVVDITHAIPVGDVAHAAYVLAQVAPRFPEGTIHVAVVDPGVGSARLSVVVGARGHLFVGPDNGTFSLVAPEPDFAYEIRNPLFMADSVSPTFHGRDVFAPAAAALAAGQRPEKAGPAVSLTLAPVPRGLEVIHVDRFGNLITNLSPEQGARGFSLGSERFDALHATFTDVESDQLIAYVGSAGTVEVAVRDGNAALRLGVARGTAIVTGAAG